MIEQTWPAYLGRLEDSPPGHRFQLYYPKGPVKGGNLEPLQWAADYNAVGREQLLKLRERQAALAAAAAAATFDFRSSAPLVTGQGNEHISENGFAFLAPYGLPYVPGSSVKGVVRRAAEEFVQCKEEGWSPEIVDALFGSEPGSVEATGNRGALIFWDCLPAPPGEKLVVDVMNAHMTHYLQESEPAHQTKPPVPIYFLTLPPGTLFRFHVEFRPPGRLAGSLAEKWRERLDAAFEHAGWLGFGAKTSVGYGVMAIDEEARTKRREEQREREEAARREAELAVMDPLQRSMQEAIDLDPDPNKKDFMKIIDALERGVWEGAERREVVERVKVMMETANEWVENSKKPNKDKKYQRTQKVLAWLKS